MTTINLTNDDDLFTDTSAGDTINALAGNDTVYGGGDTLFGGLGDDTLYGGAGSNALNGDEGDDRLFTSGGADTVDGGAGVNTWVADYSAASGNVTFTQTASRTFSFSNGAAGQNVDTFSVTLGAGNDVANLSILPLTGTTDVLNGGGGSNTLNVNLSSDTFNLHYSNSLLGDDNFVSRLVDLYNFQIANITSGSGADTFSTTGAANILHADGGSGQDVAILDFSDAVAALSFTLNATPGAVSVVHGQGSTLVNIEAVTLYSGSGKDTLIGGPGDDSFYGGGGDDSLHGGPGNDRLDGGAGVDTLYGGPGDDTFVVDNTGDHVIEKPRQGIDTVLASASFTLGPNVENLTLTGTDPIDGTGNTLANHIIGNAAANVLSGEGGNDTISGGGGDDVLYGGGNDTLDGGAGNDTLAGGSGIDTASYASAAAGVTVSLAVTGPQDTGGSGTDTLSNIENLTGSAFDDTLEGSAGNNVLKGGGGVDTLSYAHAGAGVTVDLAVTAAQDTGGAGIDTLKQFTNLDGSTFDDTLTGTGLANAIDGGAGDDVIVGRAGADVLTGGLGADRFVYTAIADSTVKVSGQDQITDFSHAQGDLIDLSAIDADTHTAGDQAFTLVGAFDHHAAELIVTAQTGGFLVQGDVDGNGKPDFAIFVAGADAPGAGDFVL